MSYLDSLGCYPFTFLVEKENSNFLLTGLLNPKIYLYLEIIASTFFEFYFYYSSNYSNSSNFPFYGSVKNIFDGL